MSARPSPSKSNFVRCEGGTGVGVGKGVGVGVGNGVGVAVGNGVGVGVGNGVGVAVGDGVGVGVGVGLGVLEVERQLPLEATKVPISFLENEQNVIAVELDRAAFIIVLPQPCDDSA